MKPAQKLLLMLLPVAALAATTQISPNKPIINFRLPTFTSEGHRSWLVRGSEARFISRDDIEIKELTLTIYTGLADGKIETMILSPAARVRPEEAVITGPDSIRVINDDFEVLGTGWRYDQKEKRVSIDRNVRVAFRAEIKAFLQ